jgi:hypothetical protein
MRYLVLGFVVSSAAWAQTMTEFGAAAAGGTAAGAAGKKVSDGFTTVFGKVDEQTKAAAKKADPPASADPGPAAQPGVEPTPKTAKPTTATVAKPASKPRKGTETGPDGAPQVTHRAVSASVPDPPPPAVQRSAVSKPAPPPAPEPAPEIAPIPPPPPPPRQATAEDLKALTLGTVREDVLKLGAPASKITMFDDGHLLEIYSYMAKNTTIGVVRLSDGAVSHVEIR